VYFELETKVEKTFSTGTD